MDNDTLVVKCLLYVKFKIGGAYVAPVGWLSASFRVKNCPVKNEIHMGAFFRDDLDDLSLVMTLIHLPQVGEVGPLESRRYILKVQVGRPNW
jgi:hypothetical protein